MGGRIFVYVSLILSLVFSLPCRYCFFYFILFLTHYGFTLPHIMIIFLGPKSQPVEHKPKPRDDVSPEPQQYAEADQQKTLHSETTPVKTVTPTHTGVTPSANVTEEATVKKIPPDSVQPETKQQEKTNAVRLRKNSKNGETYSIGSSTTPASRRGSGLSTFS